MRARCAGSDTFAHHFPIDNSSCDLQEGIDAAGEHEEEYFQFESSGRDRVDRVRKQALQQAEPCLNLLAIDLLDVFDPGGNGSPRVLFPMWKKGDLAGVGQDVFGKTSSVKYSL